MAKILQRRGLRFLSSTGPFMKGARSDVHIERLGSDTARGLTHYRFQQVYAVRAPLSTLLHFGFPRDRLVVATDIVTHGRFRVGILHRLKPAYVVQESTNDWGYFLYSTMKSAEARRRIAEYNAAIPARPAELAREFPREVKPAP